MPARQTGPSRSTSQAVPTANVFLVDPFGRTRDYDEALYTSLRDTGHSVRLLTTEFNDKRNVEGLGEGFFLRTAARLQQQFPTFPVCLLKGIGALEYLLDLVRVTWDARRCQAVLHWQWVPFGPLTMAVTRLSGAGPNVLTAHNIVPHDSSDRRGAAAIERMKYRWADRIVVHSRRLEAELVEFCPEALGKTCVIPAGLQHEQVQPMDSRTVRASMGVPVDSTLIGFMGLVRPYKGLSDLLIAWRNVVDENREAVGSQCRLVVAGDWSQSSREDRDELARTAAVDPTLIVIDRYLPEGEYTSLLNALDLAVLPYRRASQSGVALGALRYSVPLLVTHTGGLPDLMQGGLSGWVAAPNDPGALVERIRAFMDMDEAERVALRAEVARIAKRLSWRTIVADYRTVYLDAARHSIQTLRGAAEREE